MLRILFRQLIFIGTLWVPLCSVAGTPPTDDDVDVELAKLGSPIYETRVKASKQLVTWVVDGQMTGGQMKNVKDASRSTDLEVRTRALHVYTTWSSMLPEVKAITDDVQVVAGPDNPMNMFDQIDFKFDAFDGNTGEDNPVYTTIKSKYEKVRAALKSGSTLGDPDPITNALSDLKSTVNGLTNDQFESLRLEKPGGADASKGDVINKIDSALQKVPQAKNALDGGSGGPSGERQGLLILPGDDQFVSLGHTWQVNFASVLAPGELHVYLANPDDVLAEPPLGWRVVGLPLELSASGLLLDGPVEIVMQYGDVQEFGATVDDPAALRIGLLANGGATLLSTLEIDLVNNRIAAIFDPPPPGSGLEQLGQFAVLKPIPIPPAWLMFASALVLLQRARFSRRLQPSIERSGQAHF